MKLKKQNLANIHVTLSDNNALMTVCSITGDTLLHTSARQHGFKGSKKSSFTASLTIAEAVSRKLKIMGIKKIAVFIKGLSKNRYAILKGLQKSLLIETIKDVTPIPHNGCSSRGPKRK